MARYPFGEYSRDRMVAAITSFYKFQSGMHSNETASCDFKYPPSTGWPQVTDERFSAYDYTVVDLIRHLPYIPSETLFVLPDTTLIGHASSNATHWEQDGLEKTQKEQDDKPPPVEDVEEETQEDDQDENDYPFFPEYMLELAVGDQYGSTILVDTKHNAIIWWQYDEGCRDIPEEIFAKYPSDWFLSYSKDSNDDSEDDDQDPLHVCRRDAWKHSDAYAPEDFFEMCKEQFRIMNWMPDLNEGGGKMIGLYRHQEWTGENLRIMQILRDAGWPGDGEGGGWDKASAVTETKRMHHEIWKEKQAERRGLNKDISLDKKLEELAI